MSAEATAGARGVSRGVHPARPDLLDAEKRMLALVAAGAPLRAVLDVLVRTVEAHLTPGTLASIVLLDGQGRLRPASAPSLPPAYNAWLEGQQAGPGRGSCGTAAFLKRAVIVSDIATDPLWEGYQAEALRHGLAACWSTPILGTGDAVLGTFALYSREPRVPEPEDLQLTDRVAFIARIAIERHRADTERADFLGRLQVAREEAEREVTRLRELLVHAPLVQVATQGPEHRLELLSAQAARRLGPGARAGRPLREACPALADHPLLEALDRALASGEAWAARGEVLPLGAGGASERFDVAVQPLREPSGQVRGLCLYALALPQVGPAPTGPGAEPAARGV